MDAMHVQRDVSGIYKNGQVLKGEVSPKKADYITCIPSLFLFLVHEDFQNTMPNGQKITHILLVSLYKL